LIRLLIQCAVRQTLTIKFNGYRFRSALNLTLENGVNGIRESERSHGIALRYKPAFFGGGQETQTGDSFLRNDRDIFQNTLKMIQQAL
jgi:hypothetical protein